VLLASAPGIRSTGVRHDAVNGFTHAEEAAAGMSSVVPFMLEDRLRAAGGKFESSGVFARHVTVDGCADHWSEPGIFDWRGRSEADRHSPAPPH